MNVGNGWILVVDQSVVEAVDFFHGSVVVDGLRKRSDSLCSVLNRPSPLQRFYMRFPRAFREPIVAADLLGGK